MTNVSASVARLPARRIGGTDRSGEALRRELQRMKRSKPPGSPVRRSLMMGDRVQQALLVGLVLVARGDVSVAPYSSSLEPKQATDRLARAWYEACFRWTLQSERTRRLRTLESLAGRDNFYWQYSPGKRQEILPNVRKVLPKVALEPSASVMVVQALVALAGDISSPLVLRPNASGGSGPVRIALPRVSAESADRVEECLEPLLTSASCLFS